MKITSLDTNCQNFKALDCSKVLSKDKKFVVKNLKILQELGKLYDIKMESLYVNNPNYSCIDVFVMPLKKNMNFWQRIFSPIGISAFDTQSHNIDDGLVLATEEAIQRLHKWCG